MAKLEIRYFTGDVEERELSPSQPISIGRRASNDVCIDESDVGAMHCRIAWKDGGYEVAAAQNDGVEVNGTLVQRGALNTEDIIRVGTVDIAFLDNSAPRSAASTRPVRDELFDDDPAAARSPVPAAPIPAAPVIDEDDDIVEAERLEDDVAEAGDSEDYDAGTDDAGRKDSLAERIAQRLDARTARPGEQEVLRSKFLNGLVVTMAILLLVSGVLYYWTQKDAAERDYAAAEEVHNEGGYKQAIDLYTKHLETYPANKSYTNKVWFGLGHARIQLHIEGSIPNWKEALAQIQNFQKENRDREGYSDETKKLLVYAERIALGACKSAERTRDRKYLPLAAEGWLRAREFLAEKGFEADYKQAYRNAEQVVEREEFFVTERGEIRAALDKKPADIETALEHRLAFLKQYPKPLPHEAKELASLLKQTMQVERALVTAAELNRKAQVGDRPERARPVHAVTLHLSPKDGSTTTRKQIVIGLAKHCVYGIDAVTGEPLWRRAIGSDTPFFPISVDVRVPSLLTYDTKFGEVLLLERATGKLIWRQPLGGPKESIERVGGVPLVHDGQLFIPTLSKRLYQLGLDSGRLITRLTFSQRVSAPAIGMKGPDQPRLIVAGERSVLYTLTLTPKLKCEAVSHLGQRTGSVQRPLVMNLKKLGSLLLLCENDGVDSCRLRVLNTSGQGEWLKELTFTETGKQVRVKGWVREVPLLRHNELYVSSSGERVTIFTVSDDTNIAEAERGPAQFLSWKAEYKDDKTKSGPVYPVYMQLGPNGQFWMASNRLRKFQLKTNTVQPDSAETAFGGVRRPRFSVNRFSWGRQTGFSTGVWITRHNREEMDSGTWRAVLGAEILAWTYSAGKHVVCLNEEGYVFRIPLDDLVNARFTLQRIERLKGKKVDQPLRAIALPDGRIAAVMSGEDPSLWFVTSTGQTERRPIPGFPETQPIVMGEGLVLPMPGRLRYYPLKSTGRVDDYEAPFVPGAKQQPKWTHLSAVSPTELIAGDSTGRLFRIQLRTTGGRRHLGKAVERKLENPAGRPLAIHNGRVIVVDSDRTIRILNPTTLQPLASITTDGPITNAPFVSGDALFVEIGLGRLVSYSISGPPQKRWELALRGRAGLAAGPQLRDGAVLVAERAGLVHWVDPANGAVKHTHSVGEPLSGLPRAIGPNLLVPSIDGAFHTVTGPGQ